MTDFLRPGAAIAFDYPHANYRCVLRKRWEPRRVLIERVRDLRDEPFEEWEIDLLEPDLNRGRLLIYGLDLEKREQRKFYVESMSRLRPIPTPVFCGKTEQPELFAVVSRNKNSVIARAVSRGEAIGISRSCRRFKDRALVVEERVILSSDDQVLEQLQ